MFSPDSSSSSHKQLLLTLPKTFLHSRRLLVPLIHYPITTTSTPNPPPPPPDHPYSTTTTTFDANVVMILSVLLCALICSLALNSVIRCILHCTNRTNTFFSITPPNSITPINRPKLPNTGIKKKALKTFTTITYTSDLKLLGLGGECVICLSEFTSGEKLRLLPRCNHGFHLRCIDKWLDSHSSCPTCRNCLIETCEKIVGDNNQQSSNSTIVLTPPSLPTPPPQQTIQQSPPPSPPPPQETVVDMPPLEREGPINTL